MKRLLIAVLAAMAFLTFEVSAEDPKPTADNADKDPEEDKLPADDDANAKGWTEKEAKKALRKLQLELHGFYIDIRPVTTFEKVVPFIVYLPLGAIYLLGMVYALCVACKMFYRYFIRTSLPSESECKQLDSKSINEISFLEI